MPLQARDTSEFFSWCEDGKLVMASLPQSPPLSYTFAIAQCCLVLMTKKWTEREKMTKELDGARATEKQQSLPAHVFQQL